MQGFDALCKSFLFLFGTLEQAPIPPHWREMAALEVVLFAPRIRETPLFPLLSCEKGEHTHNPQCLLVGSPLIRFVHLRTELASEVHVSQPSLVSVTWWRCHKMSLLSLQGTWMLNKIIVICQGPVVPVTPACKLRMNKLNIRAVARSRKFWI